MKIGKTIAISLSKGGTGKSTSCINLAAALAAQGHSVAVVDNDPQANLSTALSHEPKTINGHGFPQRAGLSCCVC